MGQDRVGIALSGGGHRATAFSLGALTAIVDSGLNRDTVSVSSVSGGSIANAIAMSGADFSSYQSGGFDAHARPALKAVAERGVLLGGAPATKTYVLSLIGTGAVGVLLLVASYIVALFKQPLVALICVVVGLLACAVAWRLLRQRSRRTQDAVDSELLGGTGRTLGDIQRAASRVHHVLCTTEMQSGEPFYFSNRCVYNYRFGGATSPVDLPLALAVQSSACVPGAFNPRVISVSDLGLQPLKVTQSSEGKAVGSVTIDNIVLTDGGTYDNMADEWEYGYASRADAWSPLSSVQAERANYLVVINGSGGWNTPRAIGTSGVAQEIAGLSRAQGVQYEVSTTHRRRALYGLFRASESGQGGQGGQGGQEGLDGIFVQITDSPYRLADQFSSAALARQTNEAKRWSTEMAARADEAIGFLDAQGYDRDHWAAVVAATSGTSTTLGPLKDVTAKLVEHGYVLTTILLFVLDGKGQLTTLDRGRFPGMCR